ncbi:MAG: META domain-containing protein [Bacteroidota bacterium]
MKNLIALLLILALVTSCNSKESKPNNRNLLQADWQLEKIEGEILNDSMTIPVLKIDLAERRLRGNSGCNTYTGSISNIGAEIMEFDKIAVTFKICPEANYEDQYMRLMNQVKTYEVNETKLVFKNDRNQVILDYAKVTGTKKSTRIHDIWSAVRIEGFPTNRMVTVPRLEVNTKEMKIYGNDGCNDYFGSIDSLTKDKITFGAIGSTRKMCQDMDIPNRYMNALNKSNNYNFDDNLLIITDTDNNEVLAFINVD